MAEDGFSGKQPVDNERQFELIEQRLDNMDKTLRNLTQMMVAWNVEGRRGHVGRQHDHGGDYPEDGEPIADGGELNGGRSHPDRTTP